MVNPSDKVLVVNMSNIYTRIKITIVLCYCSLVPSVFRVFFFIFLKIIQAMNDPILNINTEELLDVICFYF